MFSPPPKFGPPDGGMGPRPQRAPGFSWGRARKWLKWGAPLWANRNEWGQVEWGPRSWEMFFPALSILAAGQGGCATDPLVAPKKTQLTGRDCGVPPRKDVALWMPRKGPQSTCFNKTLKTFGAGIDREYVGPFCHCPNLRGHGNAEFSAHGGVRAEAEKIWKCALCWRSLPIDLGHTVGGDCGQHRLQAGEIRSAQGLCGAGASPESRAAWP